MMWVRIEEIILKEDIIFIPQSLVSQLEATVSIRFGQKRIEAQVRALPVLMELGGETFEHPQTIQMTPSLIQELLIVESIHLQMMITEDGIQLGPVIGLLLGNENYRYNTAYMRRHSDILGIYHQVGGLICAFSPETIDWEKKSAYGLYHNYFNQGWEYGELPLPEVVYRRNSHTKPQPLHRLKQVTGGKVFNSERLGKWDIYEIIKDCEPIKPFIPETQMIKNFSEVDEFLNKYEKVILKPTYLSRGRGICVIERVKDDGKKLSINHYYSNANYKMFTMVGDYGKHFRIHDYRYFDEGEIFTFSSWALQTFLEKEDFFVTPYLIQPLLPLAKINGSPFDVRIVMQKNESGEWIHSGTECRIANHGNFLTNISRGGYALFLKETLQQAFGYHMNTELIEKEMLQLCYQFCQAMDQTGEHYAEFGIDVAIDIEGKLWFIEANVFPSFKGFKHMNYDNYLSIRYQPLLYAAQLDGFASQEN